MQMEFHWLPLKAVIFCNIFLWLNSDLLRNLLFQTTDLFKWKVQKLYHFQRKMHLIFFHFSYLMLFFSDGTLLHCVFCIFLFCSVMNYISPCTFLYEYIFLYLSWKTPCLWIYSLIFDCKTCLLISLSILHTS